MHGGGSVSLVVVVLIGYTERLLTGCVDRVCVDRVC